MFIKDFGGCDLVIVGIEKGSPETTNHIAVFLNF